MKTFHPALRASAAAAAVLLAGQAHAQFSTDGYFRSGTGAGDKNNSVQCYGLAGDSLKYRLGNECDTYIEVNLKNTFKVGDMQFSANVMPTYGRTGNGTRSTDIGQAYVEGSGLDFAPKLNFWAGKRYYGRADIHITDTKYTQLDGTGGGVDSIEVAGGKLGLSYFRRDTNETVGWGTASRVNVEYSTSNVNPGGWLRVLAGFVNSEESYVDGSGNTIDGRNGVSLTIQHYQDKLFDLGGGNTIWLQYAKGSSALNGGFAKAFNNPGADGNDWAPDSAGNNWLEDHRSLKHARIADSFTWQTGAFGGQLVAHYQQDDSTQFKTKSTSFGGRAAYAFTTNFKLVGEAGVSTKKPGDADRQRLSKFTIAPTLSTGTGFFDRPELRLFYTHATWNDAAAAGGNGLPTDKSSGNRYGLQAEIWW
jgi:maltoporin